MERCHHHHLWRPRRDGRSWMRLSSKGYRVFSYDDGELVMPYEDLDKYTAGGFHPVNLGDTFQGGRYTLITSQAWLWRLFDRVARV